jgi:polyhydroxyalkanoate synthesis regulator protein
MQNLVSGYLEQGMKLLLTQQQQARESFRGATGVDLGAMTEFTERNINQWRSLQEQWLKQVVVAAIDQRHRDRLPRQRLGTGQAPEASANDDDVRFISQRDQP